MEANSLYSVYTKIAQLEMWANAQSDGRPAEYVQRRKVWLTPTTRVPCSNAKPIEICRGAPNYRIDLSR